MTNTTTGRRRKRERNFVTIENSMFEDSRLSWKAKGLLGYLLTKPDGWIVRIPDIVKHATDGEKAVRSAIKELKKYGYLNFRRIKKNNGHWAGVLWEYDDVPMFDVVEDEEEPQSEEPQGIEPYADFRHVENGHAENGIHISNKDFSNTDLSKNTNTDYISIMDDDKRTASSSKHNEDNINAIIENFREVTKSELSKRSFDVVKRNVVSKYNQGAIGEGKFRDYFQSAISNKISELELRRQKAKPTKQRIEQAPEEYQRKVPFYNWLES